MIELFNIDCMEYMATQPDNAFDLAIVDPPYGININNSMGRRKGTKKSDYKKITWDNEPPKEGFFKELRRVSKNQIIWGANYFVLPASSCWIVWDKWISEKMSFSQCELAYTSFAGVTKIFKQVNNGTNRVSIHPTAKPVKLYDWLLKNYAKPGQRILDTHLGSGSSAIAAHYFGVDFVGCELDEDYYKAAKQRFDLSTRQMGLF